MTRRPLFFCLLLWTCGAAWAFELSAPPPLSTSGGAAIFLVFSLDNPGEAASVELEPRFPDGFALLSARERRVGPGTNLLPLSVEVAAGVAAGRYQLCLALAEDPAEACASVQVTAREALDFDVPRQVFGDTLELRLANHGNQPLALTLQGEGEVGFDARSLTLPPGGAETVVLTLRGTGRLRLYVNDALYLVEVRRLDGAPPERWMEFRAGASYDVLSRRFGPQLSLQGDLSDYAGLEGQLWPEPYLRLDWEPGAVALGWLPSPYRGLGLWGRYGQPWGAEAGAGLADGRTAVGAGVVHSGASPARLRLFYDGSLRAYGSVEDLALGDWRASASFGGGEMRMDLRQTELELDFGLRYGYRGDLRLAAGMVRGETRTRLSYTEGDERRLELGFGSGPIAWTVTGVLDPFRVDWQVGFHEPLGPGRYGLQLGIRAGAPVFGASYSLGLPWVPGLSAGAALRHAGAWHVGGALSYSLAPWHAALDVSERELGLQLGYSGESAGLSLSAALGEEPRVSLSGSYAVGWRVPEPVIEAFGGRDWARLEGRVRLALGEGLEGVFLGAGERRVQSGPDGRYSLWLPPGVYTVGLLAEGLPLETIPPRPVALELARAERLDLDFVLQPAGALRLVCGGAASAGVGLNLFGPGVASLVACGRSVGGLPAGRYRLEPFGLGEELLAEHPPTVEVVAGETRQLALTLSPRPLPEISRPELVLSVPSLLTAAPGERLTVSVSSNAALVYAVLPDGRRLPLARDGSETSSVQLQIPFDFALPLYRLDLVGVSGGERLERRTLIRIDRLRPLFETRIEPAQGAVGEGVTVSVTTRFTPEAVRLTGPGLALDLEAAGPDLYQVRFDVPAAWQGEGDVTLTLSLTGERTLTQTYRFRLRD